MAGGVLAVYSYRRRVPGASLNLGSGALLGAVSGLFGSLFLDVVAALRILLSHDRDELRKTAFAALDKVVQSTDPQLQESGQQFLRSFNTPGGFITLMVIGAVVACAMFIFFSVLGGAIGANITRQNQKSGPKAH